MVSKKRMSVIAAMVALAVSASTAAGAAPVLYKYETAVSCDGLTIKSVGTFYPLQTGQARVEQTNQTTQSSSTKVWFLRSNGNETGAAVLSNGTAATWNNVPAGTWTLRALRTAAKNCNGALPGHGNYTLHAFAGIG